MQVFATTFLLIFLLCLPAQAEDMPDYFPAITAEEQAQALQKEGLKDCDTFIKKYFSAGSGDLGTMVQAPAYEAGFCVKQDIEKAIALYEKTFLIEGMDFFSIFYFRLALIYEFGPEHLRNPQRVNFLIKQFLIISSLIKNKEIRTQTIGKILYDRPTPSNLEKHIAWIDSVLSKSSAERKTIAKDLKQEGFIGTDGIWNSLEEKPITHPGKPYEE